MHKYTTNAKKQMRSKGDRCISCKSKENTELNSIIEQPSPRFFPAEDERIEARRMRVPKFGAQNTHDRYCASTSVAADTSNLID